VRLSLNITNFSPSVDPAGIGAWLGRIARAADESDLDTLWVSDHLLQADPSSSLDSEMLEAYTTLGFLASQTQRIRLGTMVSAVTYRPPALLIKAVTTLDVLSGGRAWLGIGAGYHQGEATAMGLPLPAMGERFERLEETLRLALAMWAGDDTSFEGTRYHLARPVNSPNSIQRPHPPILVGGMGETKTMPLVARYADACNLFDIPDGGKTVAHKLAVLARHCEKVGRAYEDIQKTLSTRLQPGETPGAFVRRCSEIAALGIEHIIVILAGPWTDDAVATVAAAARRC
jgi:F420-dependent oxidoreductase-like protein